jgi:hypothetical protein
MFAQTTSYGDALRPAADLGSAAVSDKAMKRITVAAATAFAALSSFALARPLQPGEVAPTPSMLARAARQIPPESPTERNEYHFRRLGKTIFVCAYHWGANGGLCVRTPLSEVKRIDDLAEDTCRHGGPDAIISHAMTGEAIVLNYDCKHSHMVREPYADHFDADGWMLGEWKSLS